MSGDAEALPGCEVNILMTLDHIDLQVHSSEYGRAGIGQSSWNAS